MQELYFLLIGTAVMVTFKLRMHLSKMFRVSMLKSNSFNSMYYLSQMLSQLTSADHLL